jgi:glycerol-3-phosphate dehydrogenase
VTALPKTTAHLPPSRVGVVGGGINGLCIAWELARSGHQVSLFERGGLMEATSCASTKLLHGGLRYLEHGELRLVREALRERSWWVRTVPELTNPIELCLPVCRGGWRARWQVALGLRLYDLLAGKDNLGRHRWYAREAFLERAPDLQPDAVLGGFSFWDGQMDDRRLGLWVAERAREAGAELCEHSPVAALTAHGDLVLEDGPALRFDALVNAAGPWAEELLIRSGLPSRHRLHLVRGSHIVFAEPVSTGYLLEVPRERRVIFVLPYQGKTLVGTTEVSHTLGEPVRCTEAEAAYLVAAHNAHLRPPRRVEDIVASFSGVRPLIRSAADPGRATREYAFERHGRVHTVFGGKWTTARSLARRLHATYFRTARAGSLTGP